MAQTSSGRHVRFGLLAVSALSRCSTWRRGRSKPSSVITQLLRLLRLSAFLVRDIGIRDAAPAEANGPGRDFIDLARVDALPDSAAHQPRLDVLDPGGDADLQLTSSRQPPETAAGRNRAVGQCPIAVAAFSSRSRRHLVQICPTLGGVGIAAASHGSRQATSRARRVRRRLGNSREPLRCRWPPRQHGGRGLVEAGRHTMLPCMHPEFRDLPSTAAADAQPGDGRSPRRCAVGPAAASYPWAARFHYRLQRHALRVGQGHRSLP